MVFLLLLVLLVSHVQLACAAFVRDVCVCVRVRVCVCVCVCVCVVNE